MVLVPSGFFRSQRGSLEVNAPAYGGQWMPHLDFNDQDPLEVHLTYELVVDGT